MAKLVSDTAKPFGARALLDPAAERALLARLPVTEITGIASRRAARLEPYGVRTCLDLARADRVLVRHVLPRDGERLWYEPNGHPVTPLHTDRPPHKMLSRGGSIGTVRADRERVFAFLVRNAERLVEELEFHAVAAGALSVYLQYRDGRQGAPRAPLPAPTNCFDLLLAAAKQCFAKAWVRGVGAMRMHIIASQLRRPGFVQLGLFDPPDHQARAVAKVKREVNFRVDRFALLSGATLLLAEVYRDSAQRYDICDIRGKSCF
jgi:nucleotidyltransferase/DNA polymerase involved in DNA repair